MITRSSRTDAMLNLQVWQGQGLTIADVTRMTGFGIAVLPDRVLGRDSSARASCMFWVSDSPCNCILRGKNSTT